LIYYNIYYIYYIYKIGHQRLYVVHTLLYQSVFVNNILFYNSTVYDSAHITLNIKAIGTNVCVKTFLSTDRL
jgi:hypothetical protein